ncbi:MAG: Glutamate 5-kinase (EC 2.7.2.11) / RNA-binding C-terminal domain PUA [Olavius algarvensis Delta 4 endosymbiont]|nr:MAG: Glutamate 5-kinase (EC 2.7.2.11) / RNA-binding C-terminal domain PUA [Olavius algarvensis Delta 4 endosymbiont]
MKRESHFTSAKRLVVKVGSNVLTKAQGLNLPVMYALSGQISELMDGGREVILVSSGAMASGMTKIGLTRRPDEIPKRQAISAVGQAGLIREYEKAFHVYGRKVAQILLTSEDLDDRQRYLNGRNTLNTLIDWQVVPVINENDTVMVEEIKVGDNDNLAAMITLLMDADPLILLTDIDGLFTRDPRVHADARLIPEIAVLDSEVEKMASDIPGPLGRGGMSSKIQAARKVTAAGVPMVIANGSSPDILRTLMLGDTVGTFFVPRGERLASRKSWIAYTLKPKGAIQIDAGAADAIMGNGKSLLPSGIVAVEGDFRKGAPVTLKIPAGVDIGTGLVNYSAADIQKIKGLKTDAVEQCLGEKPYDEVIHRDNLALTYKE